MYLLGNGHGGFGGRAFYKVPLVTGCAIHAQWGQGRGAEEESQDSRKTAFDFDLLPLNYPSEKIQGAEPSRSEAQRKGADHCTTVQFSCAFVCTTIIGV